MLSKNLKFTFFILCFAISINGFASSIETEKKLMLMVERGIITQDQANQQLADLKLQEQSNSSDNFNNAARNIASTLSEKTVYRFTNEPIEIKSE